MSAVAWEGYTTVGAWARGREGSGVTAETQGTDAGEGYWEGSWALWVSRSAPVAAPLKPFFTLSSSMSL